MQHFTCPRDDTCDSKRKLKTTLANVNGIERDNCQSEENMKMTLVKVKVSKSANCKHESKTCESEGV